MFKLEIKPSKDLSTKYGTAKLNNEGYYHITSGKENNHGKLLHRLIWEEYYGELTPKTHIHHIDKNPLNNCIWNLEPISDSEHSKLHNIGKKHSLQRSLAKSKKINKSGYFRVFKETNKKNTQGFFWRYQFYENGKKKSVSSVSLAKLEKEVKKRGWIWKKIR